MTWSVILPEQFVPMRMRTETASVITAIPEDMWQVPDAAPKLWTPPAQVPLVPVHPAPDTTGAGTVLTMDGLADIAGES